MTILLAAGCGDSTAVDAGTGLDAGAADSGADDAGTSDAGASDSGTDAGPLDAGTGDAGTGDSGTGDAGTGDAGADAGAYDAGPFDAGPAPTVTVRDVAVYANCMPVVSPDPILAFWTTEVSGASVGTATLTDAKLELTGAGTLSQSLTVDTPTITLVGGSGTQMQRKTGADVTPTMACRTFCRGRVMFSLELTFDVGGVSIPVVQTGSFGCVY